MASCSSGTCPCGWGGPLSSFFNANVTISNSAKSGTSIQTWLYGDAVSSTIGSDTECELTSTDYDARWTTMLSGMQAGDYLVIQFGINDTSDTCPRHVGETRFSTLLGDMATSAAALGVNVLFLTADSGIACSGSTAYETGSFNDVTTAAGTTYGVPVIDMNALSAALYNSLGLCPNDGVYTSTTTALGQFFCNDFIHYEAAGAEQIAGLFTSALQTQGIGLAAYLL